MNISGLLPGGFSNSPPGYDSFAGATPAWRCWYHRGSVGVASGRRPEKGGYTMGRNLRAGQTGIIVPDVVQRKPAYMLNGISASPTGRPCPRRLTTDRRRERRTYDVKTGKQSN